MASVENYIPYQPNAQGLTEALIDLKSTMFIWNLRKYLTNHFKLFQVMFCLSLWKLQQTIKPKHA